MLGFEFLYPWLLLLFIPALLVTLVPHFRLKKRFRRTRNRIISLVLRLIVFVFAITLLSGMTITYTIPNDGNEIILLVDVSDSLDVSKEDKENCIANIIDGIKYDLEGTKLGIVTFGYDQKYVAPLSDDIDEVYGAYVEATEEPDNSATNIAAALKYAKGLFTEDATWKKIVVISDGKETDESANEVIRSIISDEGGIMHVDFVDVKSKLNIRDAQVVGIQMPAYHVEEEQECQITVQVQSTTPGMKLSLRLYDNNVMSTANGDGGVYSFTSTGAGDQTIIFKHTFAVGGLHALKVELVDENNYDYNNTYTSYYYIDIFNKVLIFESEAGESENLRMLLEEETATANGAYEVTVINITEAIYDQLPKTVNDYRQYDQVIFNNISNENLAIADRVLYEGDYPEPQEGDPTINDYQGRTISMIYSYVSEYGGGLFTVGGNDEEGNANSYSRVDMKGSVYQQMLPVEVINYTPPVGVMIIIDRSGSMTADKLTAARNGAYACLDVLTERDYVGIMTLDSTFNMILAPTSVVYKDIIRERIDTIDKPQGATNFSEAIRRAGQELSTLTTVAKRHIIIVTDGMPGESEDKYIPYVQQYYTNDGTTISIVLVGSGGSSALTKMYNITNAAGGKEAGSNCYVVTDVDKLPDQMRGDLETPAIKENEAKIFNPTIADSLSLLTKGFETLPNHPNKMIATLGGFYGVKLKADKGVDLVLTGEYNVPLYAQWAFGLGRVGSFMSDLRGTTDSWSSVFMADEDGRQFVLNVVANLMPFENIRPSELTYEFEQDNYTNSLTIFDTFEDGEYIRGAIYAPALVAGEADTLVLSLNASVAEDVDVAMLDAYVTMHFTTDADVQNVLACNFVFKRPGVYRIDLEKIKADGTSSGKKVTIYKTFSYSEEYDLFEEDGFEEQLAENLKEIALRGSGTYVTDLDDTSMILNAEDTIKKVFDPRVLFMILAIIFVLLDVAVRKFKFKWIHEIIREKKQQKKA